MGLALVALVEQEAGVVRLEAPSPFKKPLYAPTAIGGGLSPYVMVPSEAVILRGAGLIVTDPSP